jgi:hypothetical protein
VCARDGNEKQRQARTKNEERRGDEHFSRDSLLSLSKRLRDREERARSAANRSAPTHEQCRESWMRIGNIKSIRIQNNDFLVRIVYEKIEDFVEESARRRRRRRRSKRHKRKHKEGSFNSPRSMESRISIRLSNAEKNSSLSTLWSRDSALESVFFMVLRRGS